MPIKSHTTTDPAYNLPNKFPDPPVFTKDADNAAFQQYHTSMVQVLTRQIAQLTAKIDTKANKP